MVFLFNPGYVAAQDDGWDGRIVPYARYVGVGGDEGKFREDWWMADGWAAGMERFSLERTLPGGGSFRGNARAVFSERDYGLRVELSKQNLGFIHIGYDQYRKYFDDTGGFFAPFSAGGYDLNTDLALDIGNFFFDVGFNRPDWPKLTLGYEHRFKDGEKSLLEWGGVTERGATRKIYPSFKEIDEDVNIFKGEIDYTVLDRFRLVDQVRYEIYDVATTRYDRALDFDAATSERVTVSEESDYEVFINTIQAESFMMDDKVYWSIGYRYMNLDGDASFRVKTEPFGPEPFDRNWFTRSVDLSQRSHIANVSAKAGPFMHVTMYGGVQGDSGETNGDTDAVLWETLPVVGPVSPEALIVTDRDEKGLEERLGLRYAGIPYTTVYLEGAWRQQSVDLFERELEDGTLDFERSTETDVNRQRYTIGLNTSPVRRLTFSARYRRSYRDNEYDHEIDTEAGYSAFIDRQKFTVDELNARLSLRPTSWLRGSLQYMLVMSDIETRYDTPGGTIETGDYDAHVYSLEMTLMPFAGLYLTGLVSYRDSRTDAFSNEVPSVVEYESDVLSFAGGAGYALDPKTTLNLQYIFSRSENAQNNAADGLPLGLDHQRHGFVAGVSRHLTDAVDVGFRYGFYTYDEDSNGGIDDYTAHMIAATCSVKF